jgi:hypothetical protein
VILTEKWFLLQNILLCSEVKTIFELKFDS